jgi:hypothetical protein
MPRRLIDYSFDDWLHLRPPLHALKSRHYRKVTEAFVRGLPRGGDLDRLIALARGQQLLITVAFNDPEILGRQLEAVRRFVPGVLHVVADNSNDEAALAQIEALCSALEVPRLWLPANPWERIESASRSHGLAMDWMWRRLVSPGRPEAFGFIDHDLIPVAPADPFEPLGRQPVAGDKRWAGGRWFLWAGYCFFRTSALDGVQVDFSQDWFIGLDTGGGNWRSIYSKLDPRSIEERPLEEIAILPGVPRADCCIERRGPWLHEVGLGGRLDLKAAKRARFLALIDEALAGQTVSLPANI